MIVGIDLAIILPTDCTYGLGNTSGCAAGMLAKLAVFLTTLVTLCLCHTGCRAAGMVFRVKRCVAMTTVRNMLFLVAILIVHIMLGYGAIVMIALLAVGLVAALALKLIIMGLSDLGTAFTDALMSTVVQIGPVIVVCGFVLSCRAPGASVVVDISVYRPIGFPVVVQGIAIFHAAL